MNPFCIRHYASVAAGITLLAFGSLGVAQPLPKEGNYDFTSCWSGVVTPIAFSKTHFAYSYEHTGSTRSNPPGGMFDKNTFHCVGLVASFEGKNTGRTVCEAIDKDGDKRLTHFATGSDGTSIRETVVGTGKYEGMLESGSGAPLGPFPVIKPGTYQDCNQQTGNYKLK